jgi:hypothetical protein
MFYGAYQRVPNVTDIQDYRDWFARGLRERIPWLVKLQDVIDFEPLSQSRAPASFLAGPLPIGTELAPAWGVPAFSIITLDDLRLRRDTPTDTLDRIDVDAILRQLRGVQDLLTNAWNDPTFIGPVERKRQRIDIVGQVVSAAPGRPVPDLPRRGFFVTYFPRRICHGRSATPRGAVDAGHPPQRAARVRCRRTLSHRRHPARRAGSAKESHLQVQVFRVDPDSGAITAASDLGRQAAELTTYVDIRPIRSRCGTSRSTVEEFSRSRAVRPALSSRS